MIPLAVGAGLSALSSLPNWYQAWKQNNRADELAGELHRPDFEIPESEKRSLQSAENQAGMTRLPGQTAIEGRLDQTTGNQINQIERMGTGGPGDINAAARAYGNQQEKENELGINAAGMHLRNQDILRNELDENADWQNKKFMYDKVLPYETKAKAIAALRESSATNFDTAWKDLFGGGANIALGEYLNGSGDGGWEKNLLSNNNATAGGNSTETATQRPKFDTLTGDQETVIRKPIMSWYDLQSSF